MAAALIETALRIHPAAKPWWADFFTTL